MSKSKFTAEQRRTIEDAILTSIDAGVLPWNRPWAVGGPRNFTTGNAYAGMINGLMLSAWSGAKGWGDDWAGKGQIKTAGGTLVEDATAVSIFAPIMGKFVKEEENGTKTLVNYIKGFREVSVYNADQVQGVEIAPRNGNTDNPVESADAMIAAMPLAPAIYHGGNSAHYTPADDTVTLPKFEQFENAAAYYAVAFHELAHATGAEKRLNRPGVADFDRFGSHQYAAEELVAEITAAHCVALNGLDRIAPSASYIATWAKRLTDDREMILQAMESAAEAVKWIEGSHHKAKKLVEAQ